MVFTDRFEHTIDEKNRLAIPSSIRSQFPDQSPIFVLVPEQRFLQLIPQHLFIQLSAAGNAGLAVKPELAKARRLLFGNSTTLEPDKAGRVVIPERFMADSKHRLPSDLALNRHVTLVGVGDRVEIWNTSEYASHLNELMADRPAVQNAAPELFGITPQANPQNG